MDSIVAFRDRTPLLTTKCKWSKYTDATAADRNKCCCSHSGTTSSESAFTKLLVCYQYHCEQQSSLSVRFHYKMLLVDGYCTEWTETRPVHMRALPVITAHLHYKKIKTFILSIASYPLGGWG
jgi:hypothetical protein